MSRLELSIARSLFPSSFPPSFPPSFPSSSLSLRRAFWPNSRIFAARKNPWAFSGSLFRWGLGAVVLCALLQANAGAADLKLPSETMPPVRFTKVYGQKIAYYELGSGPTLVLLHGMGGSASSFSQVMRPLSAHYRVIALDQLGWGFSDKPSIDYSIDTWVESLGEFLREMGISHTLLAGGSLGGWIAAKYAIAAGQAGSQLPQVDKLILVDAAGHSNVFTPSGTQNAFSYSRGPSTFAEFRTNVNLNFYNKSLLTEAYLREAYVQKLAWRDGDTSVAFRNAITGDPKKLKAQSVDGHIQEIHVPTLVIWGENDPTVPLANGRDFAKTIAGAKLVVIPECGHEPIIEKTDQFLKATFEFLGAGN
jgi:2-hydroxy-6-oxonona-2,4-dienedioate hydrolase